MNNTQQVSIKEIERYQEIIAKGKSLLDKAQGRLESLNAQEFELISRIEQMGLTVDTLDAEIENMQKEEERLFEEAKNLIPEELIRQLSSM